MSTIVHRSGAGKATIGFASGLRWSVLASGGQGGKGSKEIRRQASHIGAKTYVTHELDGDTFLGQYTVSPTSKSEPKSIHSLALGFIAALSGSKVDIRTVNAILVVEPEDLPLKRALVVIEGGQIERDVLENAPDALKNALRLREILPEHVIYAQHPAELPGSRSVDWTELTESCSKSTQLKPIPVSPILGLSIVASLLVIAGFLAYQKFIVEPERIKQRRIAVQKANKTPEYLELLRGSLNSVGWNRSDLQNHFKGILAEPFYHQGWALEEKDCSSQTSECAMKWKREGGVLSSLFRMLPEWNYVLGESTLELVTMRQKHAVMPTRLVPDELKTYKVTANALQESLQRLKNTNVTVSTGLTSPWPSMDFTGVAGNVVANRAEVSITAELPRINAALAELPPTVVMDSYVLKVSSGDVANIFNVTVKGYVYAK